MLTSKMIQQANTVLKEQYMFLNSRILKIITKVEKQTQKTRRKITQINVIDKSYEKWLIQPNDW